ncbi:MAG: spermidine/putrescine ABC transporter ATP-binding protein [Eubacteriales bacterium]|nr:spermidine/putrescine ABC transporter ATP-binding protein [Eubacteriales bacterium]
MQLSAHFLGERKTIVVEDKVVVELKNVSKEFDGQVVLNNISMTIKKNEFVTLLGPSGCGKTTTLRIIGGFEYPTEGTVLFDGEDITGVPPYKRKVNTVFQKYALFPHLNVYDNIAFGLKIAKISSSEIKKRVNQMLELVNLGSYAKRSVDSLSGGQQQRIAIARALVNRPKVLLLDEPLGALDLKLRKSMQLELKTMQQEVGITFLYVTHDQEEALTMSDRIVVMHDGDILQVGTPKEIYDEPVNAFVANFIGDSNIYRGIMLKDELVNFAGADFQCVDKGFANNEAVDVVVRPEDIKLVEPGKGQINGIVKSALFKGVHYEMIIETEKAKFTVQSTKMREVGMLVGINIIPFNIHIMKLS